MCGLLKWRTCAILHNIAKLLLGGCVQWQLKSELITFWVIWIKKKKKKVAISFLLSSSVAALDVISRASNCALVLWFVARINENWSYPHCSSLLSALAAWHCHYLLSCICTCGNGSEHDWSREVRQLMSSSGLGLQLWGSAWLCVLQSTAVSLEVFLVKLFWSALPPVCLQGSWKQLAWVEKQC